MTTCQAVRRDVGPFVDGELNLSRRAAVARHLEVCPACAHEAQACVDIGESLRAGACVDMPSFDGLASNVIVRTRAESAQSWTTLVSHAFDDWHCAIVGSGALGATFLSTLLVSVVLVFGPAPARPDSLSALLANLGSPAGALFVCASPAGTNQGASLFQVENGQPTASRMTAALMSSPCGLGSASEADVVEALATAVTGTGGRVVRLDAMHPARREYTESLLTEIARMRSSQLPAGGRLVAVRDYPLRLVTGLAVVAKAL
jgi:anti-sigma factor RsiW